LKNFRNWKKAFGFDLVGVSGKILYSVENSQGLFVIEEI
jgi:hypothetical protein